MKVLLVLVSLAMVLSGCDSAKNPMAAADSQGAQGSQGAVGPDGLPIAATPSPRKSGDWMWDKKRGNPLERPAERVNYN